MLQKVPYFLGLDLNIDLVSRTVIAVPSAESLDASRPARVCAVDAPSSADDVPPLRGALCRRTQGQELLVSGPVPVHGLRTIDLPRESSRYRVEPSSPSGEALPFGDSRLRLAQHSGQCQCDARLAYLRELRRALDRHRTWLVCRGTLRRGFGPDGLRARRYDDRSVFVGLSLGTVSFDEGRRQTAHVARLPNGMQDEASLVVHIVSTRNPKSLTRTRVETISNYDLRVENLLGSMSALCSNGSSSTSGSKRSSEFQKTR
jgi:hypothetical protein